MDSQTWSRRFGGMEDGPRDVAAGVAAQRVRNLLFAAEPPPRFGRYRPLHVVGRGGQGIVFLADDPVLDRRIALKLVEAGDPAQARRVLREAQLLARVPHPNIAPIYDVGVVGGQVFLAMEFVEGRNLQAWLAAKPRSSAQILDVMLQVARALAFAHDAAVVHCDVKPHNVLVGTDGRARVVDFGLARLQRAASAMDVDATGQIPIWQGSLESIETTIDASQPTGGGTPAYAAPEVWRNEPIEAAADQFGYFVMLYESLFGQRPFGEVPGRQLVFEPHAALTFPRSDAAPRWLRQLVRRGLAPTAAERHASMQVVCSVLARPQRSRRRLAALAVTGVLATAAVALGADADAGVEASAVCHGIAAPAADRWDATTRAQVIAHARTFGEQTAANAALRLDAHAERLRASRAEACAREADVAVVQLRCLDGLDREHAAAIDWLARGRAQTRAQLAGVLDGLEGPDACLSRATDVDDPEVAALLAESRVLLRAGRPQDAYATSVLACSKLPDHEGAQWARCRGEMGTALMLAGRVDEAKVLLEEGFELAAGLGRDEIAVNIAGHLATITVDRRADGDARRWIAYLRAAAQRDHRPMAAFNATIAEAQLHALDDDYTAALALLDVLANAPDATDYTANQRAALEARLGLLRGRLGDSAAAHQHFARGLALVGELTPGDPIIGSLHSLRGQQLGLDGEYEASLAEFRVALALADADLGPASATAIRARDGIADALMRLDRLDEALQIANDNVHDAEVRADALDLTGALHTRANIYFNLGRYADARREAIATLTFAETEFGTSVMTRNARLVYAQALQGLGEYAEAKVVAETALAESIAVFGLDHPETMAVVIALAVIEAHSGNHAEAIVLHRRARAGFAAAFGDAHPAVAVESYNIGDSLLQLGDPAAAIPEIERALAIWSDVFGPAHTDTRDAVALLARAREAAAKPR